MFPELGGGGGRSSAKAQEGGGAKRFSGGPKPFLGRMPPLHPPKKTLNVYLFFSCTVNPIFSLALNSSKFHMHMLQLIGHYII